MGMPISEIAYTAEVKAAQGEEGLTRILRQDGTTGRSGAVARFCHARTRRVHRRERLSLPGHRQQRWSTIRPSSGAVRKASSKCSMNTRLRSRTSLEMPNTSVIMHLTPSVEKRHKMLCSSVLPDIVVSENERLAGEAGDFARRSQQQRKSTMNALAVAVKPCWDVLAQNLGCHFSRQGLPSNRVAAPE